MFHPQTQALTIDAKLSSRRMISLAILATSVPLTPMAKPTSARFKASASFVPSPVTATMSPHSLKPATRRYLWWGHDQASTLSYDQIVWKLARFLTLSFTFLLSHSQGTEELQLMQTSPPTNSSNSSPVKTVYFSSQSLINQHSFAIAVAVYLLSPVTIQTLIPAF